MPHHPKPWFRSDRGVFCVQIHGKQVNLGPDREAAFASYHELMRKPVPQLSCNSVAVVIDTFLEWVLANRARRSYDFYRERGQSFLDSVSKAITVGQLRPYHIQQWADGRKWSDGMKRGAIGTIQRAFNWAAKMGHIDSSPIARMEKPPQGRREQVLTPDLFKQMLGHVKDAEFADLVNLAWETGARPQELIRIEVRHFDAARQRIVFPQKEAKGKKHIRVICLTPAAWMICKRLIQRHIEGPILRNTDGNPWNPGSVNCRFVRLKRKLGEKSCLYDFRHSFVTRALKNGVDPVTLAHLMGHRDTSMIARVYANLSHDPEYLQASMRKAAS